MHRQHPVINVHASRRLRVACWQPGTLCASLRHEHAARLQRNAPPLPRMYPGCNVMLPSYLAASRRRTGIASACMQATQGLAAVIVRTLAGRLPPACCAAMQRPAPPLPACPEGLPRALPAACQLAGGATAPHARWRAGGQPPRSSVPRLHAVLPLLVPAHAQPWLCWAIRQQCTLLRHEVGAPPPPAGAARWCLRRC